MKKYLIGTAVVVRRMSMNDDRIMNVPDELRKLMRKFGDLCFALML